jgi:DNA helicase-2/ATP-dependent DNA helicase PcrA
MVWSDGLAGIALQIAQTAESPLRVMAGPSTGKSFAMKRRVARLLEEGVVSRRILAVTFTRNAAAQLVKDLHDLGIEGCDEIRAGTLHAFCFRLLGRHEVFEFSGRIPRPVITFTKSGVLQFEGKAMLEDLAGNGQFGTRRDRTRRIRAFEAAWARLQSEQPGWPHDPVDAGFQAELLAWLRFHRAILIGELVPEALRYLRNNPGCAALTAFDHVIVDEYQDLNRAEQELIDLLAGNGDIAVVGDVDQSIYRFRYANPEGIESFAATHPVTHDEILEKCRRCPTRVVQIADHLIRHNHLGGREPRLRPLPGNPHGQVHIVQWPSIADETTGLCTYIAWLIRDQGYSPGDILVLTPRRLLGYRIRDYLAADGITVHSFYHEEALESENAQWAFGLLTLLSDRTDRVALRWSLGYGSPTSRRGAYARVREHCEATGISPWNALVAMAEGQLEISHTGDLVAKFNEIRQIVESLENEPLETVVDSLMPTATAGLADLREAALFAIPGCENIAELFEVLKTGVTEPEMPQEGDFVRVMSLHKSKGLTTKVTIIAGCIDGLIPVHRPEEALDEQQQILREQRRLFYVAITRCTDLLVISSVLRLPRNLAFQMGAEIIGRGDPVAAVASQFLAELGPHAPAAKLGSVWRDAGYA